MAEQERSLARPRGVAAHARLFLTGCAMGAADLVPGVSGGTMAFVLGVYQDLLDGIRAFNLEALRLALRLRLADLAREIPLRFLLTLGLGILAAVFTLAGFLSNTLDDPTGRVHLFAFFFGLVLASIVAVGRQVRWALTTALSLAGGALIAFAVVNLAPAGAEPTTPNLFLAGMVAVCAMILPGISGSFILLILGQYDHVLRAVSERDFGTVLTVAAGAVVGIVIFSRVLAWLLRHRPQTTIAALAGFMVGSAVEDLALEGVRAQRPRPPRRLALPAGGQPGAAGRDAVAGPVAHAGRFRARDALQPLRAPRGRESRGLKAGLARAPQFVIIGTTQRDRSPTWTSRKRQNTSHGFAGCRSKCARWSRASTRRS